MRLNRAAFLPRLWTHEGAPAKRLSPEQELRRSVLACLLWEGEFYEAGETIAERIARNAKACDFEAVASLALEARHEQGLRHVPLLLLLDLIRRGGNGVAPVIRDTISRADEVTELVALYWQGGKRPLSKQMKLGLAQALKKFDAYQLAKYDRPGPVRLRDVLFLVHPRPESEQQKAVFDALAERRLAAPDTWEVGLSTGGDKRETFERLLRQRKLGYLALLRNLRGMLEAGVDQGLIKSAILERRGAERVWPFRFYAAAKAAPQLERVLDKALKAQLAKVEPWRGRTVVLVDVSGSMTYPLSQRSSMDRMTAAAALASLVPGKRRVFTFSERVVEVPSRDGMAGIDAVLRSQDYRGTWLGKAVKTVQQRVKHDRLIVITDEQSHDRVPDPIAERAYMINVASYQSGVGYGRWTHIDGFSEAVLSYIGELERLERS